MALCGHGEKVAICKARSEASGEANPADTLVLDSKPQSCARINFCCVNPPGCGVCYGGCSEATQVSTKEPQCSSVCLFYLFMCVRCARSSSGLSCLGTMSRRKRSSEDLSQALSLGRVPTSVIPWCWQCPAPQLGPPGPLYQVPPPVAYCHPVIELPDPLLVPGTSATFSPAGVNRKHL